MTRWDHALTIGTASTGLGGALVAQVTLSPQITVGAIALFVVGLLSLWVRGHFALSAAQLDTARIKTELEVYRRLCAQEHVYPFSPTGEPACAMPDQIERARQLLERLRNHKQ